METVKPWKIIIGAHKNGDRKLVSHAEDQQLHSYSRKRKRKIKNQWSRNYGKNEGWQE